jgi:hypothetical protein
MRDIELLPVGDVAYASPSTAGLPASTTLVDPSFTDVAYAKPSLGGEFGPGRVTLLSGPTDGGVALLAGEPEAEPESDPVPEPEAEVEHESKHARKPKRRH